MPVAYHRNSGDDGQACECDIDGDKRQTFFTDAVFVPLVVPLVALTVRGADAQRRRSVRNHMACECRLGDKQANDKP